MNPVQRFYGHPQRTDVTIVRSRNPLAPLHGDRAGSYWARRRWDGGSASSLFKCQKLERLHAL